MLAGQEWCGVLLSSRALPRIDIDPKTRDAVSPSPQATGLQPRQEAKLGTRGGRWSLGLAVRSSFVRAATEYTRVHRRGRLRIPSTVGLAGCLTVLEYTISMLISRTHTHKRGGLENESSACLIFLTAGFNVRNGVNRALEEGTEAWARGRMGLSFRATPGPSPGWPHACARPLPGHRLAWVIGLQVAGEGLARLSPEAHRVAHARPPSRCSQPLALPSRAVVGLCSGVAFHPHGMQLARQPLCKLVPLTPSPTGSWRLSQPSVAEVAPGGSGEGLRGLCPPRWAPARQVFTAVQWSLLHPQQGTMFGKQGTRG